jgi:hypothetical protein
MLRTSQEVKFVWICDICGEEIDSNDLVRFNAEYGYKFERTSLDIHVGCLGKLTIDQILPKGVSLSK